MRKLACFGTMVAALLAFAGTARADPFTVSSHPQSIRGVDNDWFNNLIKLSNPPNAATKTYLSNSIIIFGGDIVAVPNDAITLSSLSAALQSGLNDHILLAGALNTLSWEMGPQHLSQLHVSGPHHGSISSSVPGASGAYDPLAPSFPGLGVSIPHVSSGQGNGNGGAGLGSPVAVFFVVPAFFNHLVSSSADPVTTGSVPAAFTTGASVSSLPATPEPSPLFLLAGGLVLAALATRYRPGLSLR